MIECRLASLSKRFLVADYNSYCAALMRLHLEKSEKHSMLESQDTEEAIVWWQKCPSRQKKLLRYEDHSPCKGMICFFLKGVVRRFFRQAQGSIGMEGNCWRPLKIPATMYMLMARIIHMQGVRKGKKLVFFQRVLSFLTVSWIFRSKLQSFVLSRLTRNRCSKIHFGIIELWLKFVNAHFPIFV